MPKYLYHVFLTHDWGVDEAGRDNHDRVSRINNVLKANGIITWFDADRMRGNIKKMMADGIDHSALAAVFITQRYMEKVNGTNQNDNCQLEFGMAGNTQTAARIIPIVMEPRMKNLTNWKGEFKLMLGTLLYMDATSDATLEQFALELVIKIKEMLADTSLFPEQDDVVIDAAASAVLVQKSTELEAPPPFRSNAVAPIDVPKDKTFNHWKPWRLLVVAGTAATMLIAGVLLVVLSSSITAEATNESMSNTTQSPTTVLSSPNASTTSAPVWTPTPTTWMDSNVSPTPTPTLWSSWTSSSSPTPTTASSWTSSSTSPTITPTPETPLSTTASSYAYFPFTPSSSVSFVRDSALYSLSTVWNASWLNGDPYLLGVTSAVTQIIMSFETGLLSWATGNPGANVWLTSGSPGYPLALAADANGNVVYVDPLTSKVTARQSYYMPVATSNTNQYKTVAAAVSGPRGVAFCQCTSCSAYATAFVANTLDNSLVRISLGSNVASMLSFTGTLNRPTALAVDQQCAYLYIADTGNHCFRRVSLTATAPAILETIAGTCGTPGYVDGDRYVNLFNTPQGLAVDGNNTLFVSDTGNHAIRKITTSGSSTTIVGAGGTYGFADGQANWALVNTPLALATVISDQSSVPWGIYIIDYANKKLRLLS